MANQNSAVKSVTIENLEAAFAGESMAHVKYRYFAKLARAAGAEDVAKIFEDTAEQEILHAFGHINLLSKCLQFNSATEAGTRVVCAGRRYETQICRRIQNCIDVTSHTVLKT